MPSLSKAGVKPVELYRTVILISKALGYVWHVLTRYHIAFSCQLQSIIAL